MKMRTVRHPLVLAALATVCGAAANAWTGRPGPRIPSLAGSRQGAVSVSDSSQKEASSAGLPAGVTAAVSIDGITQYNFSNGLRVLLIPDDSKATITVNITYLVGSRNEVYGETGMAHLLEHLMFKGTPAHPNIPDEMSAHGCSLGNTLESASGLSNGTTWFDRTNYYETFPATEDNLKWALELEADRMIHSFIARKDLDSEMTVVRNELESDENDPITVLKQRTRSAAYEWHNYSKDTIGARSDIENVPISRLQGFYHRYYQPDNAVLIVAGKFDAPKTLSAIDRAFGTIPRPSRELERSYTVEPAQDGEREATVRAVADTQALVLGYHIPAGSHRDMAAIEIFAGIVADPPSGRLFKLLNAHAEGAVVNNQVLFQHDRGMVFCSAQIGKESSFTETRGKMIETIEGMGAAPPTQEEVDRVRAAEESAIDSRFASTTANGIWLSEWIALGDWRLFFVYRDSLKKVSPADVARVAKYYFQPSNRTVAALIPTDKPDRAEIPPTADIEAIANGYKGSGPAASEGEAFDP
ncbi:MAG TPA: pitrilysin family protein, partial [Blastocatellia bacterium]|nr:pitrilysin family protein [Blastocatellia bacterium]